MTIGTAIPATMIWDDIRRLEDRRALWMAGNDIQSSDRKRSKPRRRTTKNAVAALSADRLRDLSMEGLAFEIVMAEESNDGIKDHLTELILSEMNVDELRELGLATHRSRLIRLQRVAVMRRIEHFYPQEWNRLERILFAISMNAASRHLYRDFQYWCEESLGEAGDLLQEVSGTELLRSKIGSSNHDYEGSFWTVYLGALARDSPVEAMAHLDHLTPDRRRSTISRIAEGVAGIDPDLAIKSALESKKSNERREWVDAVVERVFSDEDRRNLRAVMKDRGFSDHDLSMSAHRLFREMERRRGGAGFSKRFSWLQANLPSPESEVHLSMDDVVDVHERYALKPGVQTWLDEAPAGDVKDVVLQSIVNGLVFADQYGGSNGPDKIVQYLKGIKSLDLRARASQAFMTQGPEEARIDEKVLLGILDDHGVSPEEKGDQLK